MTHKEFVISRLEDLVKHSNEMNAKIIGTLEEVKAGNCHRLTIEEALKQVQNLEKAQISLSSAILTDLESVAAEILP